MENCVSKKRFLTEEKCKTGKQRLHVEQVAMIFALKMAFFLLLLILCSCGFVCICLYLSMFVFFPFLLYYCLFYLFVCFQKRDRERAWSWVGREVGRI